MSIKKVKALMLTDYYQMSFISITIILMQIFDSLSMLFWSAASGECTSPLTANFGLVAMFLLTNSFTLDEQKGTKILKKTMPYTDNEFVLSKYLMPVLFVVFKCISDIALSLAGTTMHEGGMSANFGETLAFHIVMVVTSMLLLPILIYPAFFRFSYKTAVKFFTVVGTISLVGMMGVMSKFVKDMVTQRSFGRMPVPAGIAAVAVTLILLVISYRLSVKFHSKSDS